MARRSYVMPVFVTLFVGSLPLLGGGYVLKTGSWNRWRSGSGQDSQRTPRALEQPMGIDSSRGIVTKLSSHTVDQTVDKLRALLQAKGITLFALVDHSGEAAKVGMRMPPTKLLIFGSPRAGTPLMLAAPSVALDLPLKILVSEDSSGKVWLSYNAPGFLADRHHVPHDLVPVLGAVEAFVSAAAN